MVRRLLRVQTSLENALDLRSIWKDPMEANDQDLVACDYRREAVGDCLDLHKEEDTGACRQDKVEGIRCRAAAPDTFLDGAKPMATFHLADHVVPSCLLLLLRCHH